MSKLNIFNLSDCIRFPKSSFIPLDDLKLVNIF